MHRVHCYSCSEVAFPDTDCSLWSFHIGFILEDAEWLKYETKTFLFQHLSLRLRLITEEVVTQRSSSLRRTKPRLSCQILQKPMGASVILLAPPLLSQLSPPLLSQLTAALINTQVNFYPIITLM